MNPKSMQEFITDFYSNRYNQAELNQHYDFELRNYKQARLKMHGSPLLYALLMNDKLLFTDLLIAGCDLINIGDPDYPYAFPPQVTSVIDCLLDSNTRYNLLPHSTFGYNPLILNEFLELCIDHRPTDLKCLVQRNLVSGDTPLGEGLANEGISDKVIQWLLHNTPIDAQDNAGKTPLHVAAKHHQNHFFKLLERRGFNMKAVCPVRTWNWHIMTPNF